MGAVSAAGAAGLDGPHAPSSKDALSAPIKSGFAVIDRPPNTSVSAIFRDWRQPRTAPNSIATVRDATADHYAAM
jgi:hypothetical protein